MPPRAKGLPFQFADEPLLLFAGAGHEVHPDTSYYYDAAMRPDVPHVVLQLTLRGTGYVQRVGERELLPAGRAFIELIPGPFQYGFATESKGPYELLFVSLAGPMAVPWMRRIHRRFGRIVDLRPDGPTADLMRTLVSVDPNSLDRYAMSASLYSLVMQLFSELSRSRLRIDERMQRAIETIDRSAGDGRFTIASLAGQMDCSREHLTRQFRLATGQSPQEYLMDRRLRLAAHALRRSEDKIDVIARRCGFSGANYLCRAFQRRWRITPARYRATPSLTVLP